jgi:hypothetical protein
MQGADEDDDDVEVGICVVHLPHALAQYWLKGCPYKYDRFDVQNEGNAWEKYTHVVSSRF